MPEKNEQENENQVEDYDTPNIVGEIDTVDETIEYLEKKLKIPVWIWVFLIIAVAFVTLYLTMGQSPTLNINS